MTEQDKQKAEPLRNDAIEHPSALKSGATRSIKAKVVDTRIAVENEHLRVFVLTCVDGGKTVEAALPQRELSVILPRSILLGEGERQPLDVMEEIKDIVRRFLVGRTVKLREFEGDTYCFFLTWRSVRF